MSIVSDLSRIKTAKSDIANAIADKGVEVPEGTKIDEYASLINSMHGKSSGVITHEKQQRIYLDFLDKTISLISNENVIGVVNVNGNAYIVTLYSGTYECFIYKCEVNGTYTKITTKTIGSGHIGSKSTVFAYNGKICVFYMGYMNTYDIASQEWSTETYFSSYDRSGSQKWLEYDGKIHMFGGYYQTSGEEHIVWDGISFTKMNNVPSANSAGDTISILICFVLNNKIYLVGWKYNAYDMYVYEYDQNTDTWTEKYTMTTTGIYQVYVPEQVAFSCEPGRTNAFYIYSDKRKMLSFGENDCIVSDCTLFTDGTGYSSSIGRVYNCLSNDYFIVALPNGKQSVRPIKDAVAFNLLTGMEIYTDGMIHRGTYTTLDNVYTADEDGEFIFYNNTYLTIIKDNTICYMQLTENSSGIYGYFLSGMVVNGIEVTTSGAQTIATTLPATVTYGSTT